MTTKKPKKIDFSEIKIIEGVKFKEDTEKRIHRRKDQEGTSLNKGQELNENSIWKYVKNHSLPERNFPQKAIDNIDKTTSEIQDFIISKLNHKEDNRIFKGLIMGNVQSGKTANYTGLAAKLADNGIRLIIILTSSNKQLHNQTYERLVTDLDPKKWFLLNNKDDILTLNNIDKIEVDGVKHYGYLIIIKKNYLRLQNFIDILNKNSKPYKKIQNSPTLIIDDEADYASLDTSKKDEQPSTINRKIRKIINNLNCVIIYLGYTATPYANAFIDIKDESDLFPRDLIYCLEPGEGYIGLQHYFGDEKKNGDLIASIPENEYKKLVSETEIKILPSSLLNSLIHFFLAEIIFREAKLTQNNHKYTHMLINLDVTDVVHEKLRNLIEEKIDSWFKLIYNHKRGIKKLEIRFKDYFERILKSKTSLTFSQIWTKLEKELLNTEVIKENSYEDIERRLLEIHKKEESKNLIVIGGNVISRGLTIKNLLVNYFGRASKNTDTLYQMGRWFGYRKDYIKISKLWITREAHINMIESAELDAELRNEIKEIQEEEIKKLKKDKDYYIHKEMVIPRILSASNVYPTGYGKRRNAIKTAYGISNKRIQYSVVKNQKSVLINNKNALKELIKSINENNNLKLLKNPFNPKNKGKLLCYGIPADLIIKFIHKYNSENRTYPLENIENFIKQKKKDGKLLDWNLAIMSKKHGEHFEIIEGHRIYLRKHRTRQELGENTFHLKGVGGPRLDRKSTRLNSSHYS